jgi:predicted Rossmann fold nucleotide-binding protein DprA/Smf involved in DNA uptake
MKEMEMLLKTVSDGLRILAQGVKVIADKIETFAEQQEADSDQSLVGSVPVREEEDTAPFQKRHPKTRARPMSSGKMAVSAPDRVVEALSRIKGPVTLDVLVEKTGLNKKQIHNAIYKLKKQGKVISVSKGVYRAAG